MNENFYLGLKARIEAGQYTMAEITAELDKRLGQGRITDERYAELIALAETCIDPNYNGNKFPTNYDLSQDVEISDSIMTGIENFELIMSLHDNSATAVQQAKMATVFSRVLARSAVGDSYVRMILEGRRTFSSVHPTKQQEVADKLIAMGREDLIDVPEYLPQEEIDPDFSVNPEEVPAE